MSHSSDSKLPRFHQHSTLERLQLHSLELPQYFAINPIDRDSNRNMKGAGTQRASINVTAFRNFLFEMDTVPIEVQSKLLLHIQTSIPFALVTFSGSASLHAIISVADTLPFKPHTESGIQQYTQAWKALNSEITSLARQFNPQIPAILFDQACKDPARLSRTPFATRPDTGLTQALETGFGGLVSSDLILSLMNKYETSNVRYQTSTISALPDNPNEKGLLSQRTLDFLNNWSFDLAHNWDWHSDFIFAVKDLQSQNYSMPEAEKILSAITGHLDTNDLYQLRDIWSRNNFTLNFRPNQKSVKGAKA